MTNSINVESISGVQNKKVPSQLVNNLPYISGGISELFEKNLVDIKKRGRKRTLCARNMPEEELRNQQH